MGGKERGIGRWWGTIQDAAKENRKRLNPGPAAVCATLNASMQGKGGECVGWVENDGELERYMHNEREGGRFSRREIDPYCIAMMKSTLSKDGLHRVARIVTGTISESAPVAASPLTITMRGLAARLSAVRVVEEAQDTHTDRRAHV